MKDLVEIEHEDTFGRWLHNKQRGFEKGGTEGDQSF